jgi:hypothetical protein
MNQGYWGVMDNKIVLTKKQLDELRSAGIIDELALRNLYIKREYCKRNARYNETKEFIMQEIADELGLGFSTVKNIIYQKVKRKKPLMICVKELK